MDRSIDEDSRRTEVRGVGRRSWWGNSRKAIESAEKE